MGPTILWMLLLTCCIQSYMHYLMVLISENNLSILVIWYDSVNDLNKLYSNILYCWNTK
jgi:hypothetical protein